jgi:hypothetical protein
MMKDASELPWFYYQGSGGSIGESGGERFLPVAEITMKCTCRAMRKLIDTILRPLTPTLSQRERGLSVRCNVRGPVGVAGAPPGAVPEGR